MKKRSFSKQARINMSNGAKGKVVSPETRKKISNSLKGKKRTKEQRKKIAENHSHYWLGRKRSTETRQKMSQAKKGEMPSNNVAGRKGALNPCWNPNRTNSRERCTTQYKNWRLAVYNRDGFKCQTCGQVGGNKLHAHHILSFAKYPSLRFDINNGITLCKKCHDLLHGRKCHSKVV